MSSTQTIKPAAPSATTREGFVQKVEFTHGEAGNQWTTIDGVRYATWWDILHCTWKIGDKVSFVAHKAPIWHGGAPVDQAHSITKIG